MFNSIHIATLMVVWIGQNYLGLYSSIMLLMNIGMDDLMIVCLIKLL